MPDLIVALNGTSLQAHERELTRLRASQPEARIILSIPMRQEGHEAHPLATHVDAVLDESQISHELIATIDRLSEQVI